MVVPGGIWRKRECASLLQVLLKLMLTYGKNSHPIINEWGGTWETLGQVRVV
jgi:hypothetical protein